MSFLAPAFLGLAALAIPLVALYMLRSRRQRVEVPSVMLWKEVGPAVSSAVPWQRLKITPLLLLQLLILAVFVALLARPFFVQESELGPHTVFVIDTSGSMAMDGRLDAAKNRAVGLARDASEANLISVIEAGTKPRVVAAFSQDAGDLVRAIEALEPGGAVEDLGAALRLARGLASPDRPTRVFLFSDGGPPSEVGPVEEPVLGVRHLWFDSRDDNVAITAFATDPSTEGTARVFVEISNFSDRERTASVEVAVEGVVTAVADIELGPLARGRDTIRLDAAPGDVVTARLLDNVDALGMDDTSSVLIGTGAQQTVTVLGEGSLFLDALIDAVPGVTRAAGAAPDLAIVDGAFAGEVDRPAWYINPERPPEGVTVTGFIENAVVTYQRPGEPLLEAVDLSQLAVARAQLVEAPGWLPLVRASDAPLVLLGEIEGRRAIYFAFDLTHSNLPVQVSYPILGARILDWLGGGQAQIEAAAPAGTPIATAPPEGAAVVVTMPDGSERTLPAGSTLFTDTAQPGVYRVAYDGEEGEVAQGPVAVRQFVAAESAGGSRELQVVAADTGGADTGRLIREWGPRILLVLIALSLVEWWLGHQRPWLRRRSLA